MSIGVAIVLVLSMQPFPGEIVSLWTSWYSGFCNFSDPFSEMFPKPYVQELWWRYASNGAATTLHSIQLFPVMICICSKEKILWWGVVAMLICGYKTPTTRQKKATFKWLVRVVQRNLTTQIIGVDLGWLSGIKFGSVLIKTVFTWITRQFKLCLA